MIYWRRYGADYLVSTIGFTMEMDGAYGRLLDHYYNSEKPLPLNRAELLRIARTGKPSEEEAVDAVIERKFKRHADGYHHARADAEIRLAQRARENGGKHVGKSGKTTDEITDMATGEITRKRSGRGIGKPIEKLTETASEIRQESTVTPQPSAVSLSTVIPQPSSGGSKAEARASRLPANWALTKEQIAWTLEKRPKWDRAHVLHVAETFRDHWTAEAGAKARKLDWAAAWRTWVGKERSNPERKAGGSIEARNEASVADWQPPETADTATRAQEWPAGEGPWWLDDDALIYYGSEIGVVGIPNEGIETYRLRCIAAAGPGPWRDGLDAAQVGQVRLFEMNGWNPARGQRAEPVQVGRPV